MTAPARFVRFGVFELDLRTGELRKRGVKIHLQEQPFQVLAMLTERAGDLVTREDLRQRLWPDTVFVDFDIGLNKAVAKLRTTLGDSAACPRFIETLERRGYRFIADVATSFDAAHREVTPGGAAGADRGGQSASSQAGASVNIVRLLRDGRAVVLVEGFHLIGRDPAAAIWIDSSMISRRHASIAVVRDVISIEDHGSRNGTFVNGRRIDGCCPLKNGDEIRVGPERFVVSAPTTLLPTETAEV